MSNTSDASDMIILKPMTGAEIIKQNLQSDAGEPGVGRYVPPSKRGEDEKKTQVPLTAEQLGSDKLFPSLSAAHGHTMTKSVSWGELRARLASSPKPSVIDGSAAPIENPIDKSMKSVIENSLKRNAAAEEEAQKSEAITDPFLMSKEKCRREGWEILSLKHATRNFNFNYSSAPEYTEKSYAWSAPILSFSAERVQKLIQPLQE